MTNLTPQDEDSSYTNDPKRLNTLEAIKKGMMAKAYEEIPQHFISIKVMFDCPPPIDKVVACASLIGFFGGARTTSDETMMRTVMEDAVRIANGIEFSKEFREFYMSLTELCDEYEAEAKASGKWAEMLGVASRHKAKGIEAAIEESPALAGQSIDVRTGAFASIALAIMRDRFGAIEQLGGVPPRTARIMLAVTVALMKHYAMGEDGRVRPDFVDKVMEVFNLVNDTEPKSKEGD